MKPAIEPVIRMRPASHLRRASSFRATHSAASRVTLVEEDGDAIIEVHAGTNAKHLSISALTDEAVKG